MIFNSITLLIVKQCLQFLHSSVQKESGNLIYLFEMKKQHSTQMFYSIPSCLWQAFKLKHLHSLAFIDGHLTSHNIWHCCTDRSSTVKMYIVVNLPWLLQHRSFHISSVFLTCNLSGIYEKHFLLSIFLFGWCCTCNIVLCHCQGKCLFLTGW